MIRKADMGDLPIIAELSCQLWPGHTKEEMQAEMAEILAKEDAAFFLAYGEDLPVGFAQCWLRHDYVEGTGSSPVGYLEGMYVVPLLGKLTKPKSYDRFFIQADACLTHDAYDVLHQIHAPTLVIGGEQDKALGGDPSREIAAKIPSAALKMYPQWGHGLYEEAKDFNREVLKFLAG